VEYQGAVADATLLARGAVEGRMNPRRGEKRMSGIRDLGGGEPTGEPAVAAERWPSLVESAPTLILVVDPDSRIQFVNHHITRLTGEFLVGRSLLDLVGRGDHEKVRRVVEHCLATGESGRCEIRSAGPLGGESWYEISVGAMRDGEEIVASILVATDITGRRRGEEERREVASRRERTQKLESLGLLAGGLAHRFNNLLLAILGNADLTLLDLPRSSAVRKSVEEIRDASLRAADLAQRMLAYSGKGKFSTEPLDLSLLVKGMVGEMEASLSETAELSCDLGEDLPLVEADPAQIRQVVRHLLLNASEAGGKGEGKISISTGVIDADREYLASSYLGEELPGGRYLTLEVSDLGCGMDSETQVRLFDPFFTTKLGGRGLGMATVLGIVRGHGGTIRVQSSSGGGSAVRVLLPPAEGRAPGDPRRSPLIGSWTGAGMGSRTVLLVDDDASVRSTAGKMISRLGLRVLVAENGLQAIEMFRERTEEIDCVILDLTMPYMSGAEAFRELRRVRSDVRVILSSGYDEPEISRQFTEDDVVGFIQKPYEYQTLAARLAEALGD
jgi:two-component system, cell cycle sensor histidine kinase and response regulator CckA